MNEIAQVEQVSFYQTEVNTLFELILSIDDKDLFIETPFKYWTINDVIGHLFVFDTAALLTIEGDTAFDTFFSPMENALKNGMSFLEAQQTYLIDLEGRELVNRWYSNSHDVSNAYNKIDPKQRLKWAGPSMSARSSITARHMETWAHGHSVFDALQKIRTETDRVRSICHLGVATFAWTFINRNLPVPETPPKIELISPSGKQWIWNPESANGIVQGNAFEFAQIVTQVRNVNDTNLNITGDAANQWMNLAQCFAGPAVNPPQPGIRKISHSVK